MKIKHFKSLLAVVTAILLAPILLAASLRLAPRPQYRFVIAGASAEMEPVRRGSCEILPLSVTASQRSQVSRLQEVEN